MRARSKRTGSGTLMVLLAAAFYTGCVAAAAGAGAGAAIYATTRGHESLATASISDVAQAVDDTFGDEGITVTETEVDREESGDEREINGKKGDLDISVHLKSEGPQSTRVEVAAKEGVANWDKDYAKELLQEILRRS